VKKLPDGSRLTYEGLEARYDALAAELAGYKESHEKYCPSAARIRVLENVIRKTADIVRAGIAVSPAVLDAALDRTGEPT
jgi:hypothetical protein